MWTLEETGFRAVQGGHKRGRITLTYMLHALGKVTKPEVITA